MKAVDAGRHSFGGKSPVCFDTGLLCVLDVTCNIHLNTNVFSLCDASQRTDGVFVPVRTLEEKSTFLKRHFVP